MKRVCVLGSTGSIGTQTLDLCGALGYTVTGLAAHASVDLLEEQIRTFKPTYVAVTDPSAARQIKARLFDLSVTLLVGETAAAELCERVEADLIVNAMGGIAGLLPSLSAVRRPLTLATANKESIVAAGDIIRKTAKEHGATVLPIDSEHSAMFQCMQGDANAPRHLKQLWLTASGGPFRGKTLEELWDVPPEVAANHPVWKMGKKVSVDSATLMNKGLELIEAVRLFDVSEETIRVLIHPQSIIHSMAEFCDGSILAQLGTPDMHTCIKFAMTYPERTEALNRPLSFDDLTLNFSEAKEKDFPMVDLARDAIRRGKMAPTALNAADEAAVHLYLNRKIRFPDIYTLVSDTYDRYKDLPCEGIEHILEADREIKREILQNR